MGLASAFRPALAGIDADAETCAALSMDIAGPGAAIAGVLLRPRDPAEVAAIIGIARRQAIALHPRGGGWSYTGGYVPQRRPAAIVDTGALQGIRIDRDAATVTAGAGVTWAALDAALQPEGLRAASFGPLSGQGATIGGSAAQNGGFFGAAGHGALGDGAVAGCAMVDGTGTTRCLGPGDRVEGLAAPQPLVGDCGAFGIRTAVTLRLVARPATTAFLSFNFAEGSAALGALAALIGLRGLGEAYVFDPGTHANLARSGFSVIESAGIAGDLLRGQGGLFERLGGLLRTARAGRAFVGDLDWSLHIAIDDGEAAAREAVAEAMRRVARFDAEPIPDVIPRVTRARPFRRIKALLGPEGERWLPLHGVLPPSAVPAALQAVQAVLAEAAEPMARHGVRAVILAVLMGGRIILEPQLFWRDALTPLHRRMALPEQVAAHGGVPANPAARGLAMALRTRLVGALDAAGAAHFQIGRSYAAAPGVSDAARAAWRQLKQRHDPDGILNPGVLGL
jgi:FAD/FMN-containing dehydrogenase